MKLIPLRRRLEGQRPAHSRTKTSEQLAVLANLCHGEARLGSAMHKGPQEFSIADDAPTRAMPGRVDWPPGQVPLAPAQRRRRAPWIATVAVVLAGGLAYLSFELYTRSERQAGQISVLRTDVDDLSSRLEQSEAQRRHLSVKLERKMNHLGDLDSQLKRRENDLTVARDELSHAAIYRDAMESQLAEFRKVTAMFRKMIDAGKLEVEFRRGRMMLVLPDAVLFSSGSAELSDDGKSTLKKVAKTLRRVSGRRFIVAGHTDDVPVHNSKYDSNWELSVHRGVVVVRQLLRHGVRRSRIAAAGFADTVRVATNRTTKGRQKNRRIEIIIEPKVVDMPSLDARLDQAKQQAEARLKPAAPTPASGGEATPAPAVADEVAPERHPVAQGPGRPVP